MKKAKFIKIGIQFFLMTIFFVSCQKHKCKNGKQDGNETSIDCGGDCVICLTCSDGIKNATETEIDCGGECQTCVEKHEQELLGTWYLDSSCTVVSGVDQFGLPYEYDTAFNYFLDPSTCKMTFTSETGSEHHMLYGNMFECDASNESEWWIEAEEVWVEGGYVFNAYYAPGYYMTEYKVNGMYDYIIFPDKLLIMTNSMKFWYHQ